MHAFAPIRRPSLAVLMACGAFVLANLLVPLRWGEVYPFTVAPMFRDAPLTYCNYRVYSPAGNLLADNSTRRDDPVDRPDPFRLRRYYDGNPVGLGVGIRPPSTLDTFGSVPSEGAVRRHFQGCLATRSDLPYVIVEQEVIGPIDAWRVGVRRTHRWHIAREEALE
jgi:hypothetical protein